VGGGHVVVDCMIGIDGVVRGCRVVTSEGGPRFTEAVLDWLIGPHAARYRPALRNGVPVPEAHRWDIYFSPP
jgi:protein TonB